MFVYQTQPVKNKYFFPKIEQDGMLFVYIQEITVLKAFYHKIIVESH